MFSLLGEAAAVLLAIARHSRDYKHLDVALSVLDLVCALQGIVDALHKHGDAVAGVQALVRVHLACHVGVSSHLQYMSG